MNRLLITSFVAAAALAAAGPARGQDATQGTCRDAETLDECGARLVNAPDAAALRVQTEERQRLERAATGVNLESAGVESSIRDFNPRFAADVITPSLVRNGSAIGLRWNIPTGFLGKVQLGTVLNDATVYQGVVSAVPEAQRTAVKEQLQDRLGPFDDVSITLAGNVENSAWGRSFESHQGHFNQLFGSARARVGNLINPSIQIDVILLRLIRDLNAAMAADRTSVMADASCTKTVAQSPFRCFTPQARAQIEAALITAALAERNREAAITAILKSAGFGRLAELVNNQPQLTFEAESRVRTGAAGPEQFSGKVRAETGFTNMNRMRGYCSARGISPNDVECLSRFTRDSSNIRGLERGHRLWGSVSGMYRSPFEYALTAPAVTADVERALEFEASAGYGVYLNLSQPKDLRDHLDLTASYKLVRDDPLRQDRFVANASYTYRLSDGTSGTIGVTYANKPEFLGDVDRKFGAHLGVSVKVPSGGAK